MTWGQQPVVVVTGASSGIGKATVEAFARAGRNVAATMRTPANAPAFDAPAERIGVFRLDVTDEASIAAGIEQIEREAGPIDVLVNNAGFGLVGPLEATAPGEIRRVIETNVIGLIAVTRAVLGPMRRRRSGVIINVGSVGGRLTFPYYSVYHATKHAVEGLSESLAFELKEFGIRVKIIEPGPIKTEFYGRGESRAEAGDLGEYGPRFERTYARMQKSGASAPGPQIVAAAIVRAAGDTSSRLRYAPGGTQLLALRGLTGDRRWVRYIGRFLMR